MATGRVIRDEQGAVAGVVEHKDASPDQLRITEVNGRHLRRARRLSFARPRRGSRPAIPRVSCI